MASNLWQPASSTHCGHVFTVTEQALIDALVAAIVREHLSGSNTSQAG